MSLRKQLVRLAILLVGFYVIVCVLTRVFFRAFLYPAPRAGSVNGPSAWTGEPAVPIIEVKASDGAIARAYDLSRPGDATVIVWLHGNGENANWAIPLAAELRARGIGAVLVEYRGYGVSRDSGAPSEQGLYADASAILDALEARGVGSARVVLFGFSLGSGVATEMAARGRARSLVLMAPYTSIPDVLSSWMPVLPSSLLIPDRFDTLSKAPRVEVKTTIVHGTHDPVVPYAHGARLAKVFPHASLVTVEGGQHADLFDVAGDRIFDAIAEHAR